MLNMSYLSKVLNEFRNRISNSDFDLRLQFNGKEGLLTHINELVMELRRN